MKAGDRIYVNNGHTELVLLQTNVGPLPESKRPLGFSECKSLWRLLNSHDSNWAKVATGDAESCFYAAEVDSDYLKRAWPELTNSLNRETLLKAFLRNHNILENAGADVWMTIDAEEIPFQVGAELARIAIDPLNPWSEYCSELLRNADECLTDAANDLVKDTEYDADGFIDYLENCILFRWNRDRMINDAIENKIVHQLRTSV